MQYAWWVIPGYICFAIFTGFLFFLPHRFCSSLDLYAPLSRDRCYGQHCDAGTAIPSDYLGSSSRILCFENLVQACVPHPLWTARAPPNLVAQVGFPSFSQLETFCDWSTTNFSMEFWLETTAPVKMKNRGLVFFQQTSDVKDFFHSSNSRIDVLNNGWTTCVPVPGVSILQATYSPTRISVVRLSSALAR